MPGIAGPSEDEIAEIISREKFANGDIDWRDSPTNSLFREASFTLTDARGETMPGLTMKLAWRRIDPRRPGDCNYKFTVFHFRGRPYRAVQIEVYAPGRLSHRGPEGLHYGPQMHIGERSVALPSQARRLGCQHHEEWFRLFTELANVTFGGRYVSPAPADLFTNLP